MLSPVTGASRVRTGRALLSAALPAGSPVWPAVSHHDGDALTAPGSAGLRPGGISHRAELELGAPGCHVPPPAFPACLRLLLAAACLLATTAAGGAAPASSPTGGVLVQRTMLPECGPSSFAVALGPDLGFSYDPGRGGVNYVWQGGFVDLGPTWKAKINQPAEVKGTIVYREQVRFPLRLAPGAGEPAYVFKGYVLRPDAVEFQYTLDGVRVREEIRAAPGGRGLVRTFRTDTAVAAWSYAVEPQPAAKLSSREGSWNEARTALTAPGGREFTLQLDLESRQP